VADAWIARQVLKKLSPAGPAARLSVLAFHHVLREHDPLQPSEPSARDFEQRLRWVSSWFNVLPLCDAVSRLKAGRLPERALAITFDDGYADNHDVALPILRKLGLHATFFVATAYLDGGRMFNDSVIESIRQARDAALDLEDLGLGVHALATLEERRAAIGRILPQVKYLALGQREAVAGAIAERAGAQLPNNLMMSSEQVAAMHAAGMHIGGHTVNHPILAGIPLQSAREEIDGGRARLEKIIAAPVRLFAYPNGRPLKDYRREHAALVQELGFDAAVSSAWGSTRAGADLFQIPRFTPWDRSRWRFGLRLVKNVLGNHVVRA
jgi:peptidoglycan/xylan/chitin deacetylase (PgdA/CDA1 family)